MIHFIRSITLLSFFMLVGCGSSEPQHQTPKLTLNWFPEVEHGGYFQAFDILSKVNVDIEPGGPDIPVIQKVASGKSQFGIVSADDVINAQAQGADVVALFAPVSTHPRCIMLRADAGIKTIEDIKDMTLAMSNRPAFSHWLRHRYALNNVKIVPYPGSIATFINHPKFGQQAYTISEPFLARNAGVEPHLIVVADLGFNPYASVLIAERSWIASNKELVQDVVSAAQEGWQAYLNSGKQAHERIHQLNPGMSLDILNFGHQELQKLVKHQQQPFGNMSKERWQTLIAQMVDCQLIDPEAVSAEQCYDLQFLK